MQTAVSSYGATISFSPKWWSYVSSTRIMVASFCNVHLADEEIADKIAMTAQELLENAVKYSASQEENVALRFEINEEDNVVSLEVTNQATPESIATLRAQYAEVCEGDPLLAYLQKMQRIAMNPNAEGSQLGLARIRYETGSEITMKVDGNHVTMGVEFQMKRAAT
ncbi:MAG: histidine kinase [Cyanobacteria bacterium RYN_339]|nr:histidine kinase [Cyanobacteria bacterium RYN_339]